MGRVSVIATRLKQARLRAKLSQKKLGIEAGVDPFSASTRINPYERDKHMPDFEMAERLAKVLKVPAPFLYARDDALAAWILAFDKASQGLKQSVLKKMDAMGE